MQLRLLVAGGENQCKKKLQIKDGNGFFNTGCSSYEMPTPPQTLETAEEELRAACKRAKLPLNRDAECQFRRFNIQIRSVSITSENLRRLSKRNGGSKKLTEKSRAGKCNRAGIPVGW